MSRRYVLLDVFADRPLEGNQLAVVLDCDGLDSARMQAIAAEFNLAETVFVLPAEKPAHRARLRIFSPASELPFAGHPTVGTAVLLAIEDFGDSGAGLDAVLMVEEIVGSIRCAVSMSDTMHGHAIFDVPRLSQPVELKVSREAAASALGLLPSEIGLENHEIAAFSAGVPYVFVPVRNLDAMARIRQQGHLWDGAFPNGISVYPYTRETVGLGRHFHGRMFWRGQGLVEDPATGSAIAAFAGVVSQFDRPTSGTHRLVVEQGFEMGRPSLITLECDISGGRLEASRIGGDAVIVARGTLYA